MDALGHAVKYASHLYTVSGGTLRIDPALVRLWGQDLYQFHVSLHWNGRLYGTSHRMEVAAVEARGIPWGNPDHPLVYALASALLEICKGLASHGCDYAIPEY